MPNLIKRNIEVGNNITSERTIPTIANSIPTWSTAIDYVANQDFIFFNNKIYKCLVSHTSGTFTTDLNSGN